MGIAINLFYWMSLIAYKYLHIFDLLNNFYDNG